MVSKKDKFLASAQKFLERGNLEKALAEFLNAVKEDAKDTRTWLRIAEIHVKRGENDKATEVYLKTAALYVEQGFFQRAVAVYKNIIKLSPGFVDAYAKLADIYRQLGLLSDAVQQFEVVASIHAKAARTKEVLAAMRQIVEISPENAVYHIKLAEAASQANLADEARDSFSRAADLLKEQGRIDEYLRVAERLVFYRPDDVPLSKYVARLYIERNNARFALAKLQACFKNDPSDTETLDLLARAFDQLGQKPKTISVLKELAKVFANSGRAAERAAVVQRILVLDPNDAEARDMAGTGARRAPLPSRPGSSDSFAPRAPARPLITFSEMAVPSYAERNAAPIALPDTAPPRSGERPAAGPSPTARDAPDAATDVQRVVIEADVFVKYGLLDRAVERLRKILETHPTHLGAHERLAAVLLQLGRRDEALAELELLAEQTAMSQPDAALEYARRALAVNPEASRAQRVIQTLQHRGQGGQAEQTDDEEFEEISTGIIEMTDASEIEPEEFGGNTESGGVVMSESSFEPTDAFSMIDSRMIEPLEETPKTDADAVPGNVLTMDASEPIDVSDEYGTAPRTMADDGEYTALLADLEQVDFFLDQNMTEEASRLLDDIQARRPPSPLVDLRRERLASLEPPVSQTPGAVPRDSGVVGQAYAGGASMPRAVVVAGGEMDFNTHRDLGIGYKDMGLHDAAINEFSLLMKDPAQEVFALTMIGECQEAKGAPADAVAFYKKALNRPTVKEAEANQLYFQLGSVFQTLGDRSEALYFFEKVAKRDPSFREVKRIVADLRGGGSGPLDAALGGKNRR